MYVWDVDGAEQYWSARRIMATLKHLKCINSWRAPGSASKYLHRQLWALSDP